MLCAQWLRTFPLLQQTKPPGWHWLTANSEVRWFPAAPFFGLALWGILLVIVLSESLRHKSCGIFALGGFLAGLAGLVAAVFGTEILRAGDVLLRPLMRPIVHEWAAGGWMFVGGILGACYGTWRRLDDVFSTRLPMILCGWLISISIFYGVLWITLRLVPAYR